MRYSGKAPRNPCEDIAWQHICGRGCERMHSEVIKCKVPHLNATVGSILYPPLIINNWHSNIWSSKLSCVMWRIPMICIYPGVSSVCIFSSTPFILFFWYRCDIDSCHCSPNCGRDDRYPPPLPNWWKLASSMKSQSHSFHNPYTYIWC